ncbi:hypothetical protein ElyMa_005822100 [Elysia marginata]|uniref:Uncharacterized protein n=1 Tax=Elysia marginata TaxID=1093978 RepID=A0AAV4FYC5_9GAST|nr:hypothetical protein ElyMa_005822100 [Elysia marginata]
MLHYLERLFIHWHDKFYTRINLDVNSLTEVQSGGLTEVQSGGLTEVQSGGLTEVQSGGLTEVESDGRTSVPVSCSVLLQQTTKTMSLASTYVSGSDNGVPISLEIERRRAMRKVHQVEKELSVFREKVLKKARTTEFSEDMQDLVQFVVDRNQVKRFPRNITDFVNLLTKVRDAAESLYKPEVLCIDSAIETCKFKPYFSTN